MTNEKVLARLGFNAEGITYIPYGGNTYNIKDTLKQAGFKYNKELGWHGPVQLMLEGFSWLSFDFDTLYNSELEVRSFVPSVLKERTYTGTSEYVGEIGERLQKITVEVTNIRECDTFYGTSTVYSFDFGGNTLTWFTTSTNVKEVNVGDVVVLSGTIKKYDIFRNEKITYLSRCKIF